MNVFTHDLLLFFKNFKRFCLIKRLLFKINFFKMFLLTGYEYFLGFLLIAAAVPVLALVTNLIVAPKGRTGERKLTYESGMEPIGGAWIQFNIRYYMFALVFVIFDVETVFLYPWAVAFNRLGLLAFIEALIFIAILVIALAYAWRKGALEWS